MSTTEGEKKELSIDVSQVTENEGKGNGIPQDVRDLIAGLEYMEDLGGCHYPLEKLEILSRVIDEVVDGESFSLDDKEIITMAYWQRKLIDEIRQILNAQDGIIMALKRRVKVERDDRYFKPDHRKLEALRSLTNAFQGDNLFYTETIDMTDLKAWAITHDFDFEIVLGLLGGEVKDRWAA